MTDRALRLANMRKFLAERGYEVPAQVTALEVRFAAVHRAEDPRQMAHAFEIGEIS